MLRLNDKEYRNLAQKIFGDTFECDLKKHVLFTNEKAMLTAIYYNGLKWSLYEWLFTKGYRIDAESYSKLFDECNKDSNTIQVLLKSEGDSHANSEC